MNSRAGLLREEFRPHLGPLVAYTLNIRQIMFRKAIYPTTSEASRQEMKSDCEKRIKIAIKTMIVCGAIFISVVIFRLFDPTMFGNFGGKILGGILAVMIVQGVNWLLESQQLKKLKRTRANR